MKVIIIRSGSYNYKVSKRSLYDSYDSLANNKTKVGITMDQSKMEKIMKKTDYKTTQIITSQSYRAISTGWYLQNLYDMQAIQTNSMFNEIHFEMKEILSQKQFDVLGKNATNYARKKFIVKLADDELTTTFKEVLERVEICLVHISKLRTENVLVISHAFFMKVFEYVIECKKNNKKPCKKDFSNFYDGSSEAYDFLSGFSFQLGEVMSYNER